MKMIFYRLIPVLIVTVWVKSIAGQESSSLQPRTYVIHRTDQPIRIDGRADERSWQLAQWSEKFVDIEGQQKPLPVYDTHFKMLWDKANLYIYLELEEPHVWAYYDKHDMVVFHENDIEVFIDPEGDTYNYYELELNARNTLFDLVLDRPYGKGGKADHDWNAAGFKSAVRVVGTLNDPTDEDQMWAVEMAIPFSALTVNGEYAQPKDGDTWKINFSRVQWKTDIADGKYIKRKDPSTGKNLNENNWVWNPQGVISMHLPERWGWGQFTDKPPK